VPAYKEALVQSSAQSLLKALRIWVLTVHSDRPELVKTLIKLIQAGDTILFKASHSVQMDLVAREFINACEVL